MSGVAHDDGPSTTALAVPRRDAVSFRRWDLRRFGTVIGLGAGFGLAMSFLGTLAVGAIAPVFVMLVIASIAVPPRLLQPRRLRPALADQAKRSGAVAALAARSKSPILPARFRVDAAGILALDQIEAGDLDAALEAAQVIERASARARRVRVPEAGYLGEVVRAILAWLVPGSGLGGTASAFFVNADDKQEGPEDPELPELILALRTLEAAGSGTKARVARQWSECAPLEARYPVLAALVKAAAARVVPDLRPVEALRKLPERGRELVVRLFPELADTGDEPYRQQALAVPQSSDLVAPHALRSLPVPAKPSPWLFAMPARRAQAGLGTGLLFAIMALLSGQPMFGVVAAVFLASGVGSVRAQRRRVAPLEALGITQPARVQEFKLAATAAGTTKRMWATTYPFSQGELMLVAGLERAEVALVAGQLEEAREMIGWWLRSPDLAGLVRGPQYAMAAGLVRMAVLLGYRQAAERLRALRPSRSANWFRERSGYGNAPAAMALARALQEAKGGDWPAARRELRISHLPFGGAIVWSSFELDVYGTLVRRLEARGEAIPEHLQPLREHDPRPWIAELWPDDTAY